MQIAIPCWYLIDTIVSKSGEHQPSPRPAPWSAWAWSGAIGFECGACGSSCFACVGEALGSILDPFGIDFGSLWGPKIASKTKKIGRRKLTPWALHAFLDFFRFGGASVMPLGTILKPFGCFIIDFGSIFDGFWTNFSISKPCSNCVC